MQCQLIGLQRRVIWMNRWKQKHHLGQQLVIPIFTEFYILAFNHSDFAGPGTHMGLQLTLNADVSDYYCSSTHSAGFKILLHSPNETPRISEFGMFVGPGRESRILVSPRINSASRLIRKVNIEQRQCVFSNEANLSYFRTYTRRVSTTWSLYQIWHISVLTIPFSL